MQKNPTIFEITDENSLKNIIFDLKKWDRIFFYGDLGAGKTTFIRHLLQKNLENNSVVVRSPTYTYYQEYLGKNGEKIFHFDLYRLENLETFYLIGGAEISQDENSIMLVEWPEIIENSIQPTKIIKISYDENSWKRFFEIIENIKK